MLMLGDHMHWQTWLKDRWQLIKDETRFTRRQFIVVGVLSAFMVAGGALTARQSRLNPVVPSRPKQITRVSEASKKPRRARLKTIFVHVSGAVAKPGLYKLKAGRRTADAVALAGGITAEGDADALNLASLITDGQKIYVPRRGDATVGPADSLEEAGVGKRLNLNTASAEELDRLDGIGPVLAKRIIDWRRRKGRFTSITQLDEVEGIGAKKLSLIKDHLTLE